jgi:hypothetical protein
MPVEHKQLHIQLIPIDVYVKLLNVTGVGHVPVDVEHDVVLVDVEMLLVVSVSRENTIYEVLS